MVSVTQWELSRLVMKCLVPLNGKYTGERRADVHILRRKGSEREREKQGSYRDYTMHFCFPSRDNLFKKLFSDGLFGNIIRHLLQGKII